MQNIYNNVEEPSEEEHDTWPMLKYLERDDLASESLDQEDFDISELVSGREHAFDQDEQYSFYNRLRSYIREVEKDIFLVDSYPNEDLINLYLAGLDPDVSMRILCKTPKDNFETVASKFVEEKDVEFEARSDVKVHDRMVFIDDRCFVFGQSVKDAAWKPTYLTEVTQFEHLREVFESLWTEADTVIASSSERGEMQS